MNKEFTAVYPDEPYKVTTKLNNTIKCVYLGRRYVLVRVNAADGTVFCVDRQSDSAEEIETFKVQEEGHFSVVLDAEVNTFEAAYLTNLYEHDDVPNYKETLPNGETYEYNYGNGWQFYKPAKDVNADPYLWVYQKDGMFVSMNATAEPLELEEFAKLIEQELAK